MQEIIQQNMHENMHENMANNTIIIAKYDDVHHSSILHIRKQALPGTFPMLKCHGVPAQAVKGPTGRAGTGPDCYALKAI